MTKSSFAIYAFHKDNRNLCEHLIKPWSMKLCSFSIKLQESKAYFGKYLSNTPGQETMPIAMCHRQV